MTGTGAMGENRGMRSMSSLEWPVWVGASVVELPPGVWSKPMRVLDQAAVLCVEADYVPKLDQYDVCGLFVQTADNPTPYTVRVRLDDGSESECKLADRDEADRLVACLARWMQW